MINQCILFQIAFHYQKQTSTSTIFILDATIRVYFGQINSDIEILEKDDEDIIPNEFKGCFIIR